MNQNDERRAAWDRYAKGAITGLLARTPWVILRPDQPLPDPVLKPEDVIGMLKERVAVVAGEYADALLAERDKRWPVGEGAKADELPYGAEIVEIVREDGTEYDVRTKTHWLCNPYSKNAWKKRRAVTDRHGSYSSMSAALSALRVAPPPPDVQSPANRA